MSALQKIIMTEHAILYSVEFIDTMTQRALPSNLMARNCNQSGMELGCNNNGTPARIRQLHW